MSKSERGPFDHLNLAQLLRRRFVLWRIRRLIDSGRRKGMKAEKLGQQIEGLNLKAVRL